MDDVIPLVKAPLVGTLVAAAIMALAGWRAPRPWRRRACWSWAVGAGVLAASGATDQWPHWPALEDRARFLTLLLPLTLLVETLAVAVPSRRVAWTARMAVAITVAPILLHHTIYLVDLSGRGSAEWSRPEAALILAALAALLALVWAGLSGLQARTSTRDVNWLLLLDAMATAVTVMLSGYYRAGLLGLGLAGALAGAAIVSRRAQSQSPTDGSLGMGVVGVFAVVMMGRFFGALSTGLAVCLLVAPLLAWIVELPRLRALPNGWRSAGRFACVVVPLIAIVFFAQRKFTAASAAYSVSFDLGAALETTEE